MMVPMAKPEASRLRVLVLSGDPARKSQLAQWVRDAGHEPAAVMGEASVVLSDGVEIDASVPVVGLGMDGEEYAARLPRGATPEQIDAALRAVAAGLLVTAPNDGRGRFGELREHDEAPLLSPREIDVLRAVSEGLTNKEIARRLDISQHTVKFHLESLMRKLAVSSRAEAVAKSLSLNLLEPYRL
jgi:DNA-binding NarL/FixJ family response regulator